MIRNVVMVKLRAGADMDAVASLQRDFRSLNIPGTLSYTVGSDLELRDGNWSFAIVADFDDTAAYARYDQDERHNELRAKLAPMAESVARVQFEL